MIVRIGCASQRVFLNESEHSATRTAACETGAIFPWHKMLTRAVLLLLTLLMTVFYFICGAFRVSRGSISPLYPPQPRVLQFTGVVLV